MSHVVSIKTELHDIEAIKRTCKELGLEFKENQKTYKWWGYSVGDYPLPDGFTKDMLGKCEHAIGVPGTDWEIGLARPNNGKGLRMLFDFFGSSGQPILNAIGGQSASKFMQLYAVHKATIEARKRGFTVARQTGSNGAIKLVCVGGAAR